MTTRKISGRIPNLAAANADEQNEGKTKKNNFSKALDKTKLIIKILNFVSSQERNEMFFKN